MPAESQAVLAGSGAEGTLQGLGFTELRMETQSQLLFRGHYPVWFCRFNANAAHLKNSNPKHKSNP